MWMSWVGSRDWQTQLLVSCANHIRKHLTCCTAAQHVRVMLHYACVLLQLVWPQPTLRFAATLPRPCANCWHVSHLVSTMKATCGQDHSSSTWHSDHTSAPRAHGCASVDGPCAPHQSRCCLPLYQVTYVVSVELQHC